MVVGIIIIIIIIINVLHAACQCFMLATRNSPCYTLNQMTFVLSHNQLKYIKKSFTETFLQKLHGDFEVISISVRS